jgi:hypothetical protein
MEQTQWVRLHKLTDAKGHAWFNIIVIVEVRSGSNSQLGMVIVSILNAENTDKHDEPAGPCGFDCASEKMTLTDG